MAMFANGIDSENTGNGTWGWDLRNAMSTSTAHQLPVNYWTSGPGGTPDYLAYFTYMKSNEKINYFITKAGSGNNAFVNAGGVTNYTSAVVAAAHSAGIKIMPYFYIYGGSTTHGTGITTSVAGEISIFNSIMTSVGGDGAVLDIENEYLSAVPLDGAGDQHEAIVDYMQGIGKSQIGGGTGSRDGFFIAYSSFPYVSFHSQVPFIELGDYCDATMPQAYWNNWATVPLNTRSRFDGQTMTPTIMVDDVNSEYAPLSFETPARQNIWYNKPNSIKPIILTGMTYDSASTTTAAEVSEFITAAKSSTNIPIIVSGGSATTNTFQAYGYRGINWFDENNTTTAERAAIAGNVVGVLPGVPANPTPAGTVAPPVTSLDWDDVVTTNTTGAATSYDVYLDASFKGNTASSQWTLSPSLTSGNHTWYVVAKNMVGNTTLSPAVSFSIVTPPPSAPSNPVPANGAVLNATFSKLDWDDAAGASSYVIYIGTSGTSFTTSVSEFAISPSDGVKFWQVKAVNSGGETLGAQWQYTLDRVAPAAALTAPVPTGGSTYLDVPITYTDAVTGLDLASITNGDITVSGNSLSYNPTTFSISGSGSTVTVTYRISAPGGTWNRADNGTYTVTQNSAQVLDVAGNARASGTIGTFSAAVPFAYQTAGNVVADYDGSGQPIVLAESGGAMSAVQNGVTLSFAGVTSATVNTTSANNDQLSLNGVSIPVAFSGGNGLEALNVLAGSYAITGDVGIANPALVVAASGAGQVNFNGNQHLAGLNLTGSSVARQSNGNGYFQVNAMTIGASAALDLNDNDLIASTATYVDLQGRVLEGYSGALDSSKTGIVSTQGQVEGGTTILALFDNALVGMTEWPPGSGNLVGANSILGKYTYIGDTNMDGQVTAQDYTAVDANIGTSADPSVSWFYGDTNFDGNIDATDYTGIDAALGLGQGNPLAAARFSQTRIKGDGADESAQREDLLSVLS